MRRSANRRSFTPVVSPHTGARGCGGKRCYESASEAQRIAKKARRQIEKPLAAYRCRKCHSWHLGEPDYAERPKNAGKPSARLDDGDEGDPP